MVIFDSHAAVYQRVQEKFRVHPTPNFSPVNFGSATKPSSASDLQSLEEQKKVRNPADLYG